MYNIHNYLLKHNNTAPTDAAGHCPSPEFGFTCRYLCAALRIKCIIHICMYVARTLFFSVLVLVLFFIYVLAYVQFNRRGRKKSDTINDVFSPNLFLFIYSKGKFLQSTLYRPSLTSRRRQSRSRLIYVYAWWCLAHIYTYT